MIVKKFIFPAVIFCCVLGAFELAALAPDKGKIASVQSGKLKEAKASWWGFDKKDSTRILQAAMDSGVRKLIIEKMDSPWITGPLLVPSNIEIVFQDGVIVQAQKNVWQVKVRNRFVQKPMFGITRKKNVTLRGEGKVKLIFPRSEQKDHRHTISILESDTVKIQNFEISYGGGDCVYVGSYNCRNVVLEDLDCLKGWRQGLSVTGCDNLIVRNCKFNDTKGTAPQCGVDLEPNYPDGPTGLTRILFENCQFNRNLLSGFYVANNSKQKIDLVLRNCEFKDNASSGLTAGHIGHTQTPNDGKKGRIVYSNCRFSGNQFYQLNLGHFIPGVAQTIENCVIDTRGGQAPGLVISNFTKDDIRDLTIRNLTVIDDENRPPIQFTSRYGNGLVDPVIENVTIQNSKGVKRAFDVAKFIRSSRPDPLARKFNVVIPDFKQIVPAFPKGRFAGENLRFREKSEVLLYAEVGQEVAITFTNKVVHRYDNPIYRKDLAVIVHSPTINIGRFGIPYDKSYTYKFKAQEKGVYRFAVDARSQTITVSCNIPYAFRADEKLYIFGCSGPLYFAVPAGVKEVSVELNGSPREAANGFLYDAQGKLVASATKLEGGKILTAKRSDPSKYEIWAIKLAVAKSWIRLGAPLVPLLSTDPDNVLIRKMDAGKYSGSIPSALRKLSAGSPRDVLRNGDFALVRKTTKKDRGILTPKFPAGFGSARAAMVTDDKGVNRIHLQGTLWAYLHLPKRGGNFKCTVKASGKGDLIAYLSTALSPSGRLVKGHRKRLPEFGPFVLTDKVQTFTFDFSMANNEIGYLYLRGKDVMLHQLDVVKK